VAGVLELCAQLCLYRHLLEQPPQHDAGHARVNGAVLWSNLHLLFWLSLLPFSTGWMGENHFARWPTVFYGLNLLACALAYYVLQSCLVRHHGPDSLLVKAIGRDAKGKASPVLYLLGIVGAWLFSPWLGLMFFVGVALMWLVPDRRMEGMLAENHHRP
jgi:uncharacterized membrane protein